MPTPARPSIHPPGEPTGLPPLPEGTERGVSPPFPVLPPRARLQVARESRCVSGACAAGGAPVRRAARFAFPARQHSDCLLVSKLRFCLFYQDVVLSACVITSSFLLESRLRFTGASLRREMQTVQPHPFPFPLLSFSLLFLFFSFFFSFPFPFLFPFSLPRFVSLFLSLYLSLPPLSLIFLLFHSGLSSPLFCKSTELLLIALALQSAALVSMPPSGSQTSNPHTGEQSP